MKKNMILPLMNLSDFYFSVNNFKGAASALQNVLNCIDVAIDPKDKLEHGPTHSFIALLISDLALANEYGGNIQEAQVFYNRSLNIIKSMKYEFDLKVAARVEARVSNFYERVGNYKEAQAYHLSSFKKIPFLELNYDHPNSMLLINPYLYFKSILTKISQEDIDSINDSYQLNSKLLEYQISHTSKTHLSLANRLIHLSICNRRLKNFELANINLNHLLEIYEAKGSKYTCLYADGLMHLSLLKTEEGKYAEAEQHVREAMRIKTTHLGYDHFHIALVYINLAQTLYEKDKSHVFNDFNDLMKEGINILKKNEIPTSHILMEKLLEVQKKSLDTKKNIDNIMAQELSTDLLRKNNDNLNKN